MPVIQPEVRNRYGVPQGRRATLAGACALVLAACSSLPPPAPPTLPAAAAAFRDGDLDGDLQRLGLAVPASATGWNLDALAVLAWQRRPELAAARADRDGVAAEAEVARAWPNPLLSLVPDFTRNSLGIGPWSLAASLATLVEYPAARIARIDQADARLRAAGWAQLRMLWQVTAEVRQARRALALADRGLALATQALALQDEIVARLDARVAAGVASTATAVEAQRQRALAAADLAATRHAREGALHALAAALALPDAQARALPLAVVDVAALPAMAGETLRAQALHDRTDLAAALADFGAADAHGRQLAAARTPGLGLAPGYAWDRGERRWSLAISFELPLADRHDAVLAAAAAQREAAGQRVLALQATIEAAVDAARLDLAAIESERAPLQAARSAQDARVAQARARWQAGIDPVDGWLDARRQAIELDLRQLALDTRHEQAVDALEAAVERPLWPASRLPTRDPHDLPATDPKENPGDAP